MQLTYVIVGYGAKPEIGKDYMICFGALPVRSWHLSVQWIFL